MTVDSQSEASVTHWLNAIKVGDADAAAELWERYALRLIRLANRKLGAVPRGATDEEDVALSAFDSFCRRAEQQQFGRLEDRHDLWQLLALITVRKSINVVRHEQRNPAGFGHNRQADLDTVPCPEPTPELAASLIDQHTWLMDQLDEPELKQVAGYRLQGYRDEEIARFVGFTRRTVQRKLQRIRKILSAELDWA